MVLFSSHLSRLGSFRYAWRTFHLRQFFEESLLFGFITFTAISRYVNIPFQYFLKDCFVDLDLIPPLMVSRLIYWTCMGQKSPLQTLKQRGLVPPGNWLWSLAGLCPGISWETANDSGPNPSEGFVCMENGTILCVFVAVWLQTAQHIPCYTFSHQGAHMIPSAWGLQIWGWSFSAGLPSPLLLPWAIPCVFSPLRGHGDLSLRQSKQGS